MSAGVPGASTLREVVPPSLDGERIDRLVALLAGVSRSKAATMIGDHAVLLDGSVVSSRSTRVTDGQVVEFPAPLPDEAPSVEPDPTVVFAVVYEDDLVLVVDKPAGLVVHPGHGNPDGTLVNGLVARYPDLARVGEAHRPGVVHRLDAGTSGLLAVARTEEARVALSDQLVDHSMLRRYTALVHGRPAPDRGMVDAPIGRSARQPTRMVVSQTGRPARTRYLVEQWWDEPDLSLVSCELETGRTHQIRVHLDAIGHSVVADPTYGSGKAKHGLGRPFLHAAALRFRHPEGHPIEVEAPLPTDLTECLNRLGVST